MSPGRASETMEPTEASSLDNQYKYYWEGDLCGHPGRGGWGCVRGPWGRGGWKSLVRGLRRVQEPAPSFSGLSPAGRMMPSETHIHIQSAVWTFEQTPSINKRLESGIPTNTWNLRFESVKRSESHIPRLPEALGCVDGHRVQAPLCLRALPRGSRPALWR